MSSKPVLSFGEGQASGPAKDDRTAEQKPPRLAGTRETLTQSERDWAYAKRALARGDDSEEVIRRIADFRADEKHDPEYYARLTVSNAQSALQSQRRPDRVLEDSATPSIGSNEAKPEH